ncbi:hypothetical protein J2W49_001893 [Hydrogenophaga palleronii]|uniref:Type III effector protein n=1 Tax=Hydrogenophaga palleronii TaxID=65655 RepID=A0ABU1WKX2_9BURK|nr:type III secretion system effector XopF2 [Hydrogenophaga palleronii]MDR7149938.1 hypothetical protein [Hydrogenophaga palleronii]
MPSERFYTPVSSFRAHEVAIDIARLSAAAGLPPLDPPVPTHKERIGAALQAMAFQAPEGPQRQAQQALEDRYIDWAAGVLASREKVFGQGRYSVDGDRQVALGAAMLPALYDGVRQFLSSSSRSPVAGAIATALGPRLGGTDFEGNRVNLGELNNAFDPAVIGGAAGGVTALAMDSTLLTAMDRRARMANLPQFKPVDLKALVPDPAPVQLRVIDGKKEYWEPLTDSAAPAASPDQTTLRDLQHAAQEKRRTLATVQDMLQARSWGLLAQPAVTGVANMLRRHWMPAQAMLQGTQVGAATVLASGTAGGLTKFGLGVLKAPAFADVDNLVGGQQRVNLFTTKLPQPDVPAASLADIAQLPRRAGETLVEAGLLARHYVAGPWRGQGLIPSGRELRNRVGDVAHAVMANTLAAVFSTATGPLVAQLLRKGAASARPDEPHNSPAYLLQQFAQSATNDFVWQASKAAFKATSFDLAASLDNWRANGQLRLLQTAKQAQGALPELARQAEQVLGAMPHADQHALQGVLRTLQALPLGNTNHTTTLNEALSDLKRHAAQGEGAVSEAIKPLLISLETALEATQQRDAMLRWSKPSKND